MLDVRFARSPGDREAMIGASSGSAVRVELSVLSKGPKPCALRHSGPS